MDKAKKLRAALKKAHGDGAELVSYHHLSGNDSYLSLVLVKWHNKFVSWLFNWSAPGFGVGHYFDDRVKAEVDFVVRIERYDPGASITLLGI